MKQLADKKSSEREFEVGEEVYLKLSQPHPSSLLRQPTTKLSPRFYGPYTIIAKVGLAAYRLQLPKGTQIHLMFHVSLLRKATRNQAGSQSHTFPLREEDPAATPVAIPDKRVIFQQGVPLTQVLVQWSSLHPDNNT